MVRVERRQLDRLLSDGRAERDGALVPLRRRRPLAVLPAPEQGETVDDVVGGDRLDGLSGRLIVLLLLARDERHQLAERCDELRLAAFLQTALEPVAEQRTERLPLSHAVEQTRREPDALGREIDGEQVVGPSPPACARWPLRSTATVAACASDGVWTKPGSVVDWTIGACSPGGAGTCGRGGAGERFITQP